MRYLFERFRDLINDDEFYTAWRSVSGPLSLTRHFRKPEQALIELDKLLHTSLPEFYYDVAAFARNHAVYDSKTRRAYSRLGTELGVQFPDLLQQEDAEYLSYWKKHFRAGMSLEELRLAVIALFQSKGYHYKTHWINYDACFCAHSREHLDNPRYYHGTFSFYIAAACLHDELGAFSCKLVKIAEKAAEITPNLSAVIAMTPFANFGMAGVHSWYVPSYREAAPPDLKNHPYWGRVPHYKGWYCTSCEWYQLISLQQQKNLPNLIEQRVNYPTLDIQPQGNGAISVKVNRPITEIDIDDLFPVKKLLYPALTPGEVNYFLSVLTGKCFVKGWLPRNKWEILPVYPEEVQVIANGLEYSHERETVVEGGIKIKHLDECPSGTGDGPKPLKNSVF